MKFFIHNTYNSLFIVPESFFELEYLSGFFATESAIVTCQTPQDIMLFDDVELYVEFSQSRHKVSGFINLPRSIINDLTELNNIHINIKPWCGRFILSAIDSLAKNQLVKLIATRYPDLIYGYIEGVSYAFILEDETANYPDIRILTDDERHNAWISFINTFYKQNTLSEASLQIVQNSLQIVQKNLLPSKEIIKGKHMVYHGY